MASGSAAKTARVQAPVGLQPAASVQEPAPVTRLKDLTWKAGCTHVVGTQLAAIVEAEVPVASGVLGADRARASQADRNDAGYLGQPQSEVLHIAEAIASHDVPPLDRTPSSKAPLHNRSGMPEQWPSRRCCLFGRGGLFRMLGALGEASALALPA
jgi:hypothetical protein